jgi:hypothetical protein
LLFALGYLFHDVIVGGSWIVDKRLVSANDIKAETIGSGIVIVEDTRENGTLFTCYVISQRFVIIYVILNAAQLIMQSALLSMYNMKDLGFLVC